MMDDKEKRRLTQKAKVIACRHGPAGYDAWCDATGMPKTDIAEGAYCAGMVEGLIAAHFIELQKKGVEP